MRSESLFGLSLVSLTFDDDADSFKSRAIVNERLTDADLPQGIEREAGARSHAARRDLPVPRRERPPHLTRRRGPSWSGRSPGCSCRCPGVADVVTFGGFLKELHVEVDPSRLLAHDLTLADVSEALEPVQPQRRRRLSSARRSAAGDPRRRLPRESAGRAGDRAQERGRHAGHRRRRRARGAVAHAAARGASATTSRARSPRASCCCAAARTRASCSTASTRRSGELNDEHPAAGHADRAVLRPHDAGRRHAGDGAPQPAVRRAARRRGRLAVPAQHALLADRGVGHPAGAAHRLHRPAADSACRRT